VRGQTIAFVIGALAAGACGKVENGPADGGGDAPQDSIDLPDDAGACEAIADTCATVDVLRSCTAVGELPTDTICPNQCAASGGSIGAHCRLLGPHFSLTRDDMAPTNGLAEITLAATSTINGADGSITNVRGAGEGIVAGIDFQIRGGVAMFRFQKLTINGTDNDQLTFTGPNSIALVSVTSITANETVFNLQGTCTNQAAGPGGAVGGQTGSPTGSASAGTSGGKGGGYDEDNGVCSGAGGGGHRTGGGGAASVSPTLGGMPGGPITAAEFRGGGGGGGGGSTSSTNYGGGGGGALHLAANKLIRISNGGVQASGCGGAGGACGCGGGAGGMIVLEADDVELLNSVLAANGGGGGGTTRGGNGPFSAAVASGGTGGTVGAGGAGSSSNATPTAGLPGANGFGGGGGGAAGRIFLNSGDGVIGMGGTTISPPPTNGTSPVE
jgi:hypothetical protein